MRHGRRHIDAALALVAAALRSRSRAPDFVVNECRTIRCDNRGDLLTAGDQGADTSFAVDAQNRIFPAQVRAVFRGLAVSHAGCFGWLHLAPGFGCVTIGKMGATGGHPIGGRFIP